MRASHRRRLGVLLALSLAVLPAGHAVLAASDPVLVLRAFAVSMTRGRANTLDIAIERWSTDEEREKLRGVLVEKGGGDALLSALQHVKPRCGYIRSSRSLGWDIQYCRETALPDGSRRIVLATDRRISFLEARNQPRSRDYQFLLIEIRLRSDGKGEGKLAEAAKVDYDRDSNAIQIENYGQEPVRLTQVEVIGPKKK